jgi:cytoskeletal protein CcmA (bactofilin family)
MKEVRDNLVGSQVISEKYELWGKVNGDVHVVEGGKFYMRGTIYGDLLVEFGGRVHIYGHVNGNVTVFRGGKLVHSGMISGNATNDGGRLYIDRDGQVLGKVKTKRGETTVEPKDDIPDEYK